MGSNLRQLNLRQLIGLRRLIVAFKQDSRGLTTAEYAVGTVAACGAGGVLLKLLLSDSFQALLSGLITRAMTQFLS
jgi:Flp pilus assembly pilin Flp